MSEDKITRTSTIDFKVHLNQERMPLQIDWDATDSPLEGRKDCKAILLSIWDGEAKQALRIDLWTKEMQVDEMQHFVFQTLATLSDTYERATNDKENAAEIRAFSKQFAEKLALFKAKK